MVSNGDGFCLPGMVSDFSVSLEASLAAALRQPRDETFQADDFAEHGEFDD